MYENNQNIDTVVVTLGIQLVEDMFSQRCAMYEASYTLLMELKLFMEKFITMKLLAGRGTSIQRAFDRAVIDVLDYESE